MDADGSNQGNLSNSPTDDGGVAWSPHGSKIAFTSYRDGNGEVYVMNFDGSDQINISRNAADDFWPSWSPYSNDEIKDGVKLERRGHE